MSRFRERQPGGIGEFALGDGKGDLVGGLQRVAGAVDPNSCVYEVDVQLVVQRIRVPVRWLQLSRNLKVAGWYQWRRGEGRRLRRDLVFEFLFEGGVKVLAELILLELVDGATSR